MTRRTPFPFGSSFFYSGESSGISLSQVESKFVNENGDLMKGVLNMNNNKITNLPNPVDNNDAVNKAYSINASNLSAGTLSIDRINDGSITSVKLSNNSITNDKISLNSDFSVNSFRIKNLAIPTENTDAANKQYVDMLVLSPPAQRYLEYKTIINTYFPLFWISGHYFNGLDYSDNGIDILQDISGKSNSLKFEGRFNKKSFNGKDGIHFDRSNRVTSSTLIKDVYTFFLIARKYLAPNNTWGRIWTGGTDNIVFGYWNNFKGVLWLNEEVIGVNNNTILDDKQITIHILVCNGDVKTFWMIDKNNKSEPSEQTRIINTKSGDQSWGGSVVIGQPSQFSAEAGEFDVYEALGFDSALTSEQIKYIKDMLIKYYL